MGRASSYQRSVSVLKWKQGQWPPPTAPLELTRAQEVHARTSSGDVDLTVPTGRYRVDTGDDEGADIEVVDDPGARHTLELDTSSGDIAVRTRGPELG